jgi:hypothetical protein
MLVKEAIDAQMCNAYFGNARNTCLPSVVTTAENLLTIVVVAAVAADTVGHLVFGMLLVAMPAAPPSSAS